MKPWTGRSWTDEDDALLRRLCKRRASWETIAGRLGRTVLACQNQATRLKCAQAKKDGWPPEEEAALAELLKAGKHPTECARTLTQMFGREITLHRVRNKAWRMLNRSTPGPDRPFRDNLRRVEAIWNRLMGDLTFEDVRVRPEAPYREAFGEGALAL